MKELSKRLSPGQKALYFIWHLDSKITGLGFSAFYWENYRKYVPPIIEGLKLIGDSSMLALVNQADSEYLANRADFPIEYHDDFAPPLVVKKEYFKKYDSIYYKTRDNMMYLLEKYARQQPATFVKFN